MGRNEAIEEFEEEQERESRMSSINDLEGSIREVTKKMDSKDIRFLRYLVLHWEELRTVFRMINIFKDIDP